MPIIRTPLPNPQGLAYVRPIEAAQWLRVDPRTLIRWAEAGKVRYMRLPNGHRRYLVTDVEALLQYRETA